jgi:lipopolysaccharide heptosyltransferase I
MALSVAIVKLSSIGDVVHALPVAAALKRHRAGTRVTWVAEAREATLLAGHPDVDDVIVADTRGWRRRPGVSSCRSAWRLAHTLRARAFDVAVDLQALLKSGMVTGLTRAPRRIGFAPGWSRERASALFTTERVRPPDDARHVVDQYVSLLAPLGISRPPIEFHLPHDPVAEAYVDGFLAGAGIRSTDRIVLMNPGAGRPDKRWPIESYREAARRLAAEPGVTVVALWGPEEEDDARAIGQAVAPATSLKQLLALARRARLIIAGDTGPLHIAAAAGVSCVGLYGPTSGVRNGPFGDRHRIVQSPGGRLAALPVDDVVAAATTLLAGAA